jgi:hypothetical protein
MQALRKSFFERPGKRQPPVFIEKTRRATSGGPVFG